MNCPDCSKKLRGKKDKVDYSKKSFEGVFVTAKVYNCKPCKKTFTDLGEYAEINMSICEYLIQPDFLSRKHLRYIMDHILCTNIFEFAKMINCHPKFVSDLIKYRVILSNELKDRIIKQIILKYNKPVIELR